MPNVSNSTALNMESESVISTLTATSGVPLPNVYDDTSLIKTLEDGFSAVILCVGLVAGLVLSKIVNWWKW